MKKGYKQTEEHMRRRLKAQRKFFDSNPNFRKGINHPRWGKHHSIESKEKMRIAKLGKKQTKEHIENVRATLFGRKHSQETIEKMRKSQWLRWNNSEIKTKTQQHETLYRSKQYKEWRCKVLIRDEFTCLKCGKKNIKLEVHHIAPWRREEFKNLIFELSNGITVCSICHKIIEYRYNGLKVERFY